MAVFCVPSLLLRIHFCGRGIKVWHAGQIKIEIAPVNFFVRRAFSIQGESSSPKEYFWGVCVRESYADDGSCADNPIGGVVS